MRPDASFDRRALLLGAGLAAAGARAAVAQGSPRGASKPAPAPASPATPAPAPTVEPRTLSAAPLRVALSPPPSPPAAGNAAPDSAAAPATVEVWTFDGVLPGPTLRAKPGEEVRLRLENRTAKPLSLHWQGARLANAADGVGGVTAPPVAPGASAELRFTPPDAGTVLARPLVVGGSAEPAGRGLAALLAVEERKPPEVDREVALLVQDWRVGPDGALEGFAGRTLEAASVGRLGNWLSVNGRLQPERIEARPGARVRLRLANACVARSTRIRFDGVKAIVAAVDGQPSDTFEPLRATLPFAPGTRYDVIVELPPEPSASAGALVALVGSAGAPLAVFATAGDPLPAGRGPVARLPENPLLPQEIRLQNATRRDVVLAGGATLGADGKPAYSGDPARIWTVNGAAGIEGLKPAFGVRRGAPVVLAVTNRTAFPQPLHLHGHVFRLLHPLDDGWEPYWLDTFQLLEGRTARIAFVADNPGRWVLGSTVLDRFDTGLWTLFEVT